jgi:methyl-CpG-binding domain protein 4
MWNPPLLNAHENPMIQEKYFPDRWKMLICCLLLNLTSIKQVGPMIDELFERYPDPDAMSKAKPEDLHELLKPLGLWQKRSKTLIRFSEEFKAGNWLAAKELYGCGKYADDSDRIFFLGEWRDVEPTDGKLIRYLDFLRLQLPEAA